MSNHPRPPYLAVPFVLFLACVVLSGCGAPNAVRGSGVLATESRDLRGFSAVELSGVGTVRLAQTGSESVTIEAEDNLLPLLSTTVEDGALRIFTTGDANLRPTRPIVFHVTADQIERVRVSGSGNVEAQGLKAPTSFTAHVSGSGNVRAESVEAERITARVSGSGGIQIERLAARMLRCDVSGSGGARFAGRADEVDLGVFGSGSLDAAGLACRAADVSVAGSGGARLGTTEQRLTADVSGSGSLRYRGKPAEVQTHVSGSGSVSRDAG